MYRFGGQGFSGGGELSGGSEGCVYVELTTSGKKWGRGPTYSDIHGGNKRASTVRRGATSRCCRRSCPTTATRC